MKTWSVFGLIIVLHVAIIGLLLVQPGCQSKPVEPTLAETVLPPPATTRSLSPAAGSQALDPSFNAGLTGATTRSAQSEPTAVSGGRALREPTRPSGPVQPRPAPDLTPLEPVLEPLADPRTSIVRTDEYSVRPGDTLIGIARREGVGLEDLLAANGIRRDAPIHVGQILRIPRSTATTTPGATAVTTLGAVPGAASAMSNDSREITVQAGDTLSRIAQRHSTSVAVLRSLNQLRSDTIFVGQTLLVPIAAATPIALTANGVAASAASPAARSGTAPTGRAYTVKAGDTISAIARQHGVTSAALMEANRITDARRIQIGQVLVLPSTAVGTGTTAASAGGTAVVTPSGQSAERTGSASPPVRTPANRPLSAPLAAPAAPASAVPQQPQSTADLEALEDADLPFVEVEPIRQPGN